MLTLHLHLTCTQTAPCFLGRHLSGFAGFATGFASSRAHLEDGTLIAFFCWQSKCYFFLTWFFISTAKPNAPWETSFFQSPFPFRFNPFTSDICSIPLSFLISVLHKSSKCSTPIFPLTVHLGVFLPHVALEELFQCWRKLKSLVHWELSSYLLPSLLKFRIKVVVLGSLESISRNRPFECDLFPPKMYSTN